MVLVQILITPSAGGLNTASGKFQVVPITGKCSIRVLAVSYHDSSAATTNRVIQIVSDNLYFAYSPLRYITLMSNVSAYCPIDNSLHDYHLKNQQLNGQLQLSVIDKATGVEPVNFTNCLISLDIEQIDKEYTE